MSSGSGVPEAVQDDKRVPDLECHRCGAAAVVTRGDVDLCGPCYYTETVTERRRLSAQRRRPGSDAALAVIEEIERALLEQLRGACDSCPK